jgi:hypothetical protein
MKRPVTVFLSVLAAGCVTLPMKYEPPQEKSVPRSTLIRASQENVWAAAVKYFSESNIPIENMDHSSFFIKTRPVDLGTTFTTPGLKVDLNNEFCDCGKARLANLYTQVNQIKASFNIVLLPKSAYETEATTNTFFDGRIVGRQDSNAVGYDFELPLKCVSTGVLENRLQTYLLEHSKSK